MAIATIKLDEGWDKRMAICKTLTPSQKLKMSGIMSRVARGRTIRIVRREHPDWGRDRVIPVVNQRMWDDNWCEKFDQDELFYIALDRP